MYVLTYWHAFTYEDHSEDVFVAAFNVMPSISTLVKTIDCEGFWFISGVRLAVTWKVILKYKDFWEYAYELKEIKEVKWVFK